MVKKTILPKTFFISDLKILKFMIETFVLHVYIFSVPNYPLDQNSSRNSYTQCSNIKVNILFFLLSILISDNFL